MSSAELTPAIGGLSEGMLGIIGAYGTHNTLDIRDDDPKDASEAPTSEHSFASADVERAKRAHRKTTG